MNKFGDSLNSINPIICRDYKDLIRSLIFIIETKKGYMQDVDLLNIYDMIVCAVRYGNVIRYENENSEILGIICYTVGTAEGDYQDTHIAHIVYCLIEPRLPNNLLLKSLQSFVQIVMSEHEGVTLFKIAAHEHGNHKNRLFTKYAHKTEQIKGEGRQLNNYTVTVQRLQMYLHNIITSS